ncbi:lamin tail domain-containing protein [Spirillospora sp. CA-294931]|uniref:lamin tail domain-containing protein n=1 Tax=Spirillospora sp. CA-294931 TaxID=3240042 RepID=UPI003D8E84BE
MKRILATGTAAVAALGLMAAPAEAASAVQIYRVYFDSPGRDTGSNTSLNGEWVQLRNTGRTARQLRGYRLRDRTGYTYVFGSYVLRGKATVKVRTGKGRNTTANRYWNRRWYVWNNTGDTAYLQYPNKRNADICSWTAKGDWKYC